MKKNIGLETRQRAKELRKNLSPVEKRIWSFFRARQFMGLHVRKQYPIGPYIADFYISKYQLVIELDGESHDFRMEKDERRDRYFEERGYRIIRIQNREFMDHPIEVLDYLRSVCMELESDNSG